MVDRNISIDFKQYTFDTAPGYAQKLIVEAQKASLRAYAPYSGFHVGCAVLLSDGTIVSGSNQENIAYSPTQCAERTALLYANSSFPNQTVCAIAIAAQQEEHFTKKPCMPCGVCRQVLCEIERRYNKRIEVWVYGTEGIYAFQTSEHLLPLSFIIDKQ